MLHCRCNRFSSGIFSYLRGLYEVLCTNIYNCLSSNDVFLWGCQKVLCFVIFSPIFKGTSMCIIHCFMCQLFENHFPSLNTSGKDKLSMEETYKYMCVVVIFVMLFWVNQAFNLNGVLLGFDRALSNHLPSFIWCNSDLWCDQHTTCTSTSNESPITVV